MISLPLFVKIKMLALLHFYFFCNGRNLELSYVCVSCIRAVIVLMLLMFHMHS